MLIRMDEPEDIPPKPNYKWPWFLLAAVIIFVALAIVWMSVAVHREEQERGFSAPVPGGSR